MQISVQSNKMPDIHLVSRKQPLTRKLAGFASLDPNDEIRHLFV